MFDTLSDRLGEVFRSVRGRGRITEANVQEAMRGIRTALLEADVHIEVVKKFCKDVLQKAIGEEVIKTLRPDQVLVKVVHEESQIRSDVVLRFNNQLATPTPIDIPTAIPAH